MARNDLSNADVVRQRQSFDQSMPPSETKKFSSKKNNIISLFFFPDRYHDVRQMNHQNVEFEAQKRLHHQALRIFLSQVNIELLTDLERRTDELRAEIDQADELGQLELVKLSLEDFADLRERLKTFGRFIQAERVRVRVPLQRGDATGVIHYIAQCTGAGAGAVRCGLIRKGEFVQDLLTGRDIFLGLEQPWFVLTLPACWALQLTAVQVLGCFGTVSVQAKTRINETWTQVDTVFNASTQACEVVHGYQNMEYIQFKITLRSEDDLRDFPYSVCGPIELFGNLRNV
jgi:hypothetical protein